MATKAGTVMFHLCRKNKNKNYYFMSLTFNQACNFGVSTLSSSCTISSATGQLHALGKYSPPFQSCLCDVQRYMLLFCLEMGLLSRSQFRCHFSRNPFLTPTPTSPWDWPLSSIAPYVHLYCSLTPLCFNHLFTCLCPLYWKFFKAKNSVLVSST